MLEDQDCLVLTCKNLSRLDLAVKNRVNIPKGVRYLHQDMDSGIKHLGCSQDEQVLCSFCPFELTLSHGSSMTATQVMGTTVGRKGLMRHC